MKYFFYFQLIFFGEYAESSALKNSIYKNMNDCDFKNKKGLKEPFSLTQILFLKVIYFSYRTLNRKLNPIKVNLLRILYPDHDSDEAYDDFLLPARICCAY